MNQLVTPGSPIELTSSILYLDNVQVAFDGYKALRGLSFVVAPNEMRAIIGPNGAGKTTMMDCITGKTRPDEGIILFAGGIDVTKLDEAKIANLGIGRKFQKPTVFESHTISDNIRLALKDQRGPLSALFGARNRIAQNRIDEILAIVRLTSQGNDLAANLSHGQKQWLEIGMLLAQDPQLLLVDEPVAGMTDAETETTADLLRHIAQNHAVLVVEHDMHFVRALNCPVMCLHEGAVLSEGSLDKVASDERVIEVYLGR